MKIPLTLITYMSSIFLINNVLAQDSLTTLEAKDTKGDTKIFNITSLEDRQEKVKIIPDYVDRVLKICCSKDTININDFWGVPPESRLLNKKFIVIKYEVRGGSNLGLGNTLILCLNHHKLCEAIHVLRYTNWDSEDLKTNYHIKLRLDGGNINNYKLTVYVHDDVNSKKEPETNYIYDNETILSFDKRLNVFYNIKETMGGDYLVSNKENTTQQKINGNFPVVILGRQVYYSINNKWYEMENSRKLIGMYN